MGRHVDYNNPRLLDCLRKISIYIKASGGPAPTTRELAYAMNTSTSVVIYYLDHLADMGLVRRWPGRARGIIVTPAGENMLEGINERHNLS